MGGTAEWAERDVGVVSRFSGGAAVSALPRGPSGALRHLPIAKRWGGLRRGGGLAGWSASAAEFGDDRFHYVVDILHHVRHRKSDHPYASTAKVGVAAVVAAEFAHVV